jgi:CTP synthase
MIFLEAMRQLRYHIGSENFSHIHVSLVPNITEPKSKPTQQSVKELRSVGLQPDMIVCRSKEEILLPIKKKISSFCMIPERNVISAHNVKDTYSVPILLAKQDVHNKIIEMLKLPKIKDLDLTKWNQLLEKKSNTTVRIGIVGKYTELTDAYLSIIKALYHSCYNLGVNLDIKWISSEDLVNMDCLKDCNGIIIPGGFGDRGTQGKIDTAKYCRINKIPLLGICMGFQIMVIEYARNVLNLVNANSEEFTPDNKVNVVINMPEISKKYMGGTMRLGVRLTDVRIDSLAYNVYKSSEILERHRHRYEVNPDYISILEEKNELIFSGRDETKQRMEILEFSEDNHPFYFGTQFHPEFNSRPLKPSPVFMKFIEKSLMI